MINKISIIIPVRNEEQYLPKCLACIAKSAEKLSNIQTEVIVVLNRSTDNSEQIAKNFGCTIVYDENKNLSKIRNAGVARATGDIVATIDADSFMSEGMITDIVSKLKKENIIGGGVMMFPERWSLGIFVTGALMMLPLSILNGFISAGLFYCRRADFVAIGGFNEEMYSAEDVDFAKRLKAYGKSKGKRFSTIISSYLVTSCRKFDRFGDWYFFKNPIRMLKLLRGKDKKTANLYWYDFNDR